MHKDRDWPIYPFVQEMREDRYVRGMLLREIAEKYKISVTHARRLTNFGMNIKSHHMKIIAMATEGHTTKEIAKEVGLSVWAIQDVKRKYAHMIKQIGEQE